MIPQIIYLLLTAVGFGYIIPKQGELILKPDQKRNTGFITYSLIFLLYWWGGFWHTFDWPQVIMILYYGVIFGHNLAKIDKPSTEKYNIWTILPYTIFVNILLYFGGFWKWR